MGREIYGIIRNTKTKEIVWDSSEAPLELWVCGRDDATGYVASLAYNVSDEVDEDDDYYQCLVPYDGSKDGIYAEIQDYAKADRAEIDKAKEALADLKIARRNARNFEEWNSFSEPIETTEEWIKDNDYSRAESLIRLLDAMDAAFRIISDNADLKMYLVVSE